MLDLREVERFPVSAFSVVMGLAGLALALGASSSMGGQDPIIHGLGLVALIALAPIISVMVLGFLLAIQKRRMLLKKGK